MKGIISPMWPMMSFRLGRVSKSPEAKSRRMCRPVSECQPQPPEPIPIEAARGKLPVYMREVSSGEGQVGWR